MLGVSSSQERFAYAIFVVKQKRQPPDWAERQNRKAKTFTGSVRCRHLNERNAKKKLRKHFAGTFSLSTPTFKYVHICTHILWGTPTLWVGDSQVFGQSQLLGVSRCLYFPGLLRNYGANFARTVFIIIPSYRHFCQTHRKSKLKRQPKEKD